LVVSDRFPYVEVQFEVRYFQEQAFAYLDTGFDGFQCRAPILIKHSARIFFALIAFHRRLFAGLRRIA
jgi:hypothetical protein